MTDEKPLKLTTSEAKKVTDWLEENVVRSGDFDSKTYFEIADVISGRLQIKVNGYNVNELMMARAQRIEFLGGRDMPPLTA